MAGCRNTERSGVPVSKRGPEHRNGATLSDPAWFRGIIKVIMNELETILNQINNRLARIEKMLALRSGTTLDEASGQ